MSKHHFISIATVLIGLTLPFTASAIVYGYGYYGPVSPYQENYYYAYSPDYAYSSCNEYGDPWGYQNCDNTFPIISLIATFFLWNYNNYGYWGYSPWGYSSPWWSYSQWNYPVWGGYQYPYNYSGFYRNNWNGYSRYRTRANWNNNRNTFINQGVTGQRSLLRQQAIGTKHQFRSTQRQWRNNAIGSSYHGHRYRQYHQSFSPTLRSNISSPHFRTHSTYIGHPPIMNRSMIGGFRSSPHGTFNGASMGRGVSGGGFGGHQGGGGGGHKNK